MEMRRRGSVPCTTTPMSPRATGNPTINTALNSPRASIKKSKSSTSLTALTSQGSGATFTSPNQSARPTSLGQIQPPRPCLFTHSQSHTHMPTISCTCCYDETNGIQDLEIHSHADSLILSRSARFFARAAHLVWPAKRFSFTHTIPYTACQLE